MRSICVAAIALVSVLLAFIAYMQHGAPADRESIPGSTVPAARSNDGSELKAGVSYPGGKIQSFRNTIINNPVQLAGDPYLAGNSRVTEPPGDHTVKTAVCGIRFVDADRKQYVIKTCLDEAEAARSGYAVTHRGYCGTCSTLSDLAVYLQRRDLTFAVRACSVGITRGSILSCLEKLGFSQPCALTWYYNIRNTTRHCLGACLLSWIRREPLNRADGSLNGCIQCDEDMSGPIFKYYAGRTRRNSGIRSEIGRGRGELYPVVHDYN
jgi:hypothetical protein